jgi:hypothetical protein
MTETEFLEDTKADLARIQAAYDRAAATNSPHLADLAHDLGLVKGILIGKGVNP